MRRSIELTNSFMAGISTTKNIVPISSMDVGIPGLIFVINIRPTTQITINIELVSQLLRDGLISFSVSSLKAGSSILYDEGST
jgi:hypothetical protein